MPYPRTNCLVKPWVRQDPLVWLWVNMSPRGMLESTSSTQGFELSGSLTLPRDDMISRCYRFFPKTSRPLPAVSYDYLMRVPRWLLDMIAGIVLLTFGPIFFTTGILSILTGAT